MSSSSPAWLAFPTLVSQSVSVNVDGVALQPALDAFDGTNLGTVANTLIVSAAQAQLSGPLDKVRSVELWMRLDQVLSNGSLQQVLPARQGTSGPPHYQVIKLAAGWTTELLGDGGIPQQVRSGTYTYEPPAVSQKNMFPSLVAGQSYQLSLAMPVCYDDSVQRVVRYADFQTASFTVAS